MIEYNEGRAVKIPDYKTFVKQVLEVKKAASNAKQANRFYTQQEKRDRWSYYFMVSDQLYDDAGEILMMLESREKDENQNEN